MKTHFFSGKVIFSAVPVLLLLYILSSKNSDKWNIPDVNSLSGRPDGEMIAYGKLLVSQTSKFIGPDVRDTSRRFSGNYLACANCHFESGQTKSTLSLVGVSYKYPRNDARSNGTETLQDRINGCLERSMNGRRMSNDSKEMKAIVKYFDWISTYTNKDEKSKVKGLPDLKFLSRAANPFKGYKIFRDKCMVCHAHDGSGILTNPKNPSEGYNVPAIFGNNSFNTGAGLYRLTMAAKFIKYNMPYKNPDLSDQDAWDVAAYINSMPRPVKPNLDKDFPDRKRKNFDTPFPPYADTLSLFQHKYGPWLQMADSK